MLTMVIETRCTVVSLTVALLTVRAIDRFSAKREELGRDSRWLALFHAH